MKFNVNDFVYASTKVHAGSGNGTAKDRLEKLLEAKNTSDVVADAIDGGLVGADASGSVTEILNLALDSAVKLVREASPIEGFYDFLLYKYDCNNLKVAIKASIRPTDTNGLYFKCGTVSPEDTEAAVKSRDFSVFPKNMAAAAVEALDTYAQNGEARAIDFILDAACFCDIAEAEPVSVVPMFAEYTSTLADIVNIRSSVRIKSAGSEASVAEALLGRVFVPGGEIKLETLLLQEGGVAGFDDLSLRLDFSPLKNAVTSVSNPEDLDCALDGYIEKITAPYFFKSFGPEIPACFLIEREAEIKRYRKASALISAGIIGREKLKERLGVNL